VFVPRYTEAELRAVVPAASTLTEVLRHFGLRPAGGNHRLLRHWLDRWNISTEHFTGTPAGPPRRKAIPLEQVMVRGSTYQRSQLKQRLYDTGLKQRRCELCGQGEEWCGARMALILDHINGTADDNRLENLRIVCPNCAATLDTHCGRGNRRPREERACGYCGGSFAPKFRDQRYCSRRCGTRWNRETRRRVERRRTSSWWPRSRRRAGVPWGGGTA
jgi:hypothetical protein